MEARLHVANAVPCRKLEFARARRNSTNLGSLQVIQYLMSKVLAKASFQTYRILAPKFSRVYGSLYNKCLKLQEAHGCYPRTSSLGVLGVNGDYQLERGRQQPRVP